MPQVKITCFCQESISSQNHRDFINIKPSDWVVLPACGHMFHHRCILNWTSYQEEKHDNCPDCRTSTKLVSITKPPSARRARLLTVKLFFGEDPKSDIDSSQFPMDFLDEAIGDDDAEDDDDEIVGGIEDEILDADDLDGAIEAERPVERNGLRGGIGNEVLRTQLREMRNTLMDVKLERDSLLRISEELQELKESSAGLSQTNHIQENLISQLEEELITVQKELEEWENGNPALHETITELNDQIDKLNGEIQENDLKVDDLNKTIRLLKKELKASQVENVEAEDTRRMEKLKWLADKKKLLERINSEGSKGAERIKSLNEEISDKEKLILNLRCVADKLEFTTRNSLEEKDLEVEAILARTKAEIDTANTAVENAKRNEQAAKDKVKIIEAANDNWSARLNKLKAQLLVANTANNSSRLPKIAPSPPSSSSPRPSLIPSSPRKRNYATEFSPLKNSRSSPEKGFRINSAMSHKKSNNGSGSSSIKRGRMLFEEDEDEENERDKKWKGKGKAVIKNDDFDDDVIIIDSSPPAKEVRSSPRSSPRFTVNSKRIKSQPMTTLTSKSTSSRIFGRNSSLDKLSTSSSDKHMPDFSKGTVVGINSKVKQRKV